MDWIFQHSPGEMGGWWIDDTLVPLFVHPDFYGYILYDRKSNYSMNVQLPVLSIPVTITY